MLFLCPWEVSVRKVRLVASDKVCLIIFHTLRGAASWGQVTGTWDVSRGHQCLCVYY